MEKFNLTMDSFSFIMTLVGWIATIIGLPSAIGFIITAIRRRKTLSWRKVKKGVHSLAKEVNKLKPDIIITFSGRGSIVASLIVADLENKYPIYTCVLKGRSNDNFLIPNYWKSFITSKWNIFVPDEILNYNNHKILIIDDITNTGETIKALTEFLEKNQIQKEKIFSMSLIADKEVCKNLHIPNYSWKQCDVSEYNVPWGKTEGR